MSAPIRIRISFSFRRWSVEIDVRPSAGRADGHPRRGRRGRESGRWRCRVIQEIGGLPGRRARRRRATGPRGPRSPRRPNPRTGGTGSGQPRREKAGHRGDVHRLGADHHPRQVPGDRADQTQAAFLGQAQPAQQPGHQRPVAAAAEQVEQAVRGHVGRDDDQQDGPEGGQRRPRPATRPGPSPPALRPARAGRAARTGDRSPPSTTRVPHPWRGLSVRGGTPGVGLRSCSTSSRGRGRDTSTVRRPAGP